MKLTDLIERQPSPAPFSEGEKIPWHEPGFSARMLAEHLTPVHDAASRRAEVIDAHVAWIHDTLLRGQPSLVLDLGCGPGLYASRLARRGHTCHGVDISPASLEYARDEAKRDGLACTYVHADLREATYERTRFGLVMLLFGEFNTFQQVDAARILAKMHDALEPGGTLLLEPHTFAAVKEVGASPSRWYTAKRGLFSDEPYVCLEEAFWNAEAAVTTQRWYIVDGATGDVTRHAGSMQAYTDDEYRTLALQAGFTDVAFAPSLTGAEPEAFGSTDLCVVTARRPPERVGR